MFKNTTKSADKQSAIKGNPCYQMQSMGYCSHGNNCKYLHNVSNSNRDTVCPFGTLRHRLELRVAFPKEMGLRLQQIDADGDLEHSLVLCPSKYRERVQRIVSKIAAHPEAEQLLATLDWKLSSFRDYFGDLCKDTATPEKDETASRVPLTQSVRSRVQHPLAASNNWGTQMYYSGDWSAHENTWLDSNYMQQQFGESVETEQDAHDSHLDQTAEQTALALTEASVLSYTAATMGAPVSAPSVEFTPAVAATYVPVAQTQSTVTSNEAPLTSNEAPVECTEKKTESVSTQHTYRDKKPGWSIGSVEHCREGSTCNPCAFYYSQAGCANSEQCQFCHLCPVGKFKETKKQKIKAMKEANKLVEAARMADEKAAAADSKDKQARRKQRRSPNSRKALYRKIDPNPNAEVDAVAEVSSTSD